MVNLIFLLLSASIFNSFVQPDKCEPSGKLKSKFFNSYVQQQELALGCTGSFKMDVMTHVLNLDSHEPGDVFIHVIGGSRENVTLFLDCDESTTWRLDVRNVTIEKLIFDDRQSKAIFTNGSFLGTGIYIVIYY